MKLDISVRADFDVASAVRGMDKEVGSGPSNCIDSTYIYGFSAKIKGAYTGRIRVWAGANNSGYFVVTKTPNTVECLDLIVELAANITQPAWWNHYIDHVMRAIRVFRARYADGCLDPTFSITESAMMLEYIGTIEKAFKRGT